MSSVSPDTTELNTLFRVWQNMDRVAESDPKLLVQRLISSTATEAAFELASLLEVDEETLQEVSCRSCCACLQ